MQIVRDKAGRRRHTANSGMTLVEVMIATMLVGFGLASSLAAFMAASRTAEASARRIAAVHNARRVMEDLRSQPYTSLAYGTWQYADGIRINVTAASGFAATKDIEVEVDWNTPGKATKAQVAVRSSVASCIHP